MCVETGFFKMHRGQTTDGKARNMGIATQKQIARQNVKNSQRQEQRERYRERPLHTHIYIYVYIYCETERKGNRERERGRDRA